MQQLSVFPYEIKAGDRILGTGMIATGEVHYKPTVTVDGRTYSSESFYGAGGGYYVHLKVPSAGSMVNGGLSYGATRKVNVLRD